MLLVAGETVYLRNYGYKPAIKRKFKFQSKQRTFIEAQTIIALGTLVRHTFSFKTQ